MVPGDEIMASSRAFCLPKNTRNEPLIINASAGVSAISLMSNILSNVVKPFLLSRHAAQYKPFHNSTDILSDTTEGRNEAEEGSISEDTVDHEAFVNAVTEVVHRVISTAPKVDSADFNALKVHIPPSPHPSNLNLEAE